ncbi:MAG TPA: PQQ-dependent sugar dehydrogenase [Caulobacteraceae bacterium]|nr:PQQ-dependent sugar dehydrogenase [Caulobacteraceae bacterium]
MKHALILTMLAAVSAAPAAGLAQPFPLTGKPPGAQTPAPIGPSSVGFPAPNTTPGQPIESRLPELKTDKPAFPGQTRAPYKPTTPYKLTVITDKLKQPWSLAFLPDGKMLVTQKPGALVIITADGTVSAPITGVPAVYYRGQVGLLDVALDRHFAANKRIFFSYSEPVEDDKSNIAIASATLDEGALALKDVKVIFRAFPAMPKTIAANQGGRLAVAKDGTLFAIIGDRSGSPPWTVAQRLDTDLGKMIHITADGAPAPGNPYIGQPDARPEIWSIGHRSEQGLSFDPKGRLWEVEDGPRGGDELNLIEPGKNYGWPIITHGIDYPGELINDGLTEKPGMVQPRYYWDPVIAPSGLAFYTGSLFPAWKDSVLIGALRGKMLDRVTLKGDKVVDEEPLLVELNTRIRDVRIGPEGAVYVLTDDTRLLKLAPQ